jgi:benzaldehyde dehydrogenase (NAD)
MTQSQTLQSAGRIYVDGSFVDAEGGVDDVLEKATGETLGHAGVGTAADIGRAVEAARRAQPAWASGGYQQRTDVLRGVAAAIDRRRDEIADLIVRETGAIRGKAEYEVNGSIEYLYDAATLASRTGGDLLPSAWPGKLNLVQRIPLGVVAVISPWNFPLTLAMYAIAPALAVGNTVVAKPAEDTPLTGGVLLAELFAEAGAPPGVFNAVTGQGEVAGEALVTHPDVAMVHFTGSTEVGRRVNELAARSLKRVSLEMGGNNAFVVLDDADIDQASMAGAWSSYHYQGQTCITASRHIVMSSVADQYVEAVRERARGIVVGDPFREDVGLGPMISEFQRDRGHGFVLASVEQGASLVEGGTYDGLLYRPTVLTDVRPEMPVYVEEVFAPVIPVTVVDSEDEALALTNGTDYGLVNAVFTGDRMRGLAFAQRVHSGMVHVNDATCLAEINVPFGGHGLSGAGWPTGGDSNLDQFTERKWISLQSAPIAYPY